jgi:hypothetical protein
LQKRHDELTSHVVQWIQHKSMMEIDDDTCRKYRARVYTQTLWPGAHYAQARVDPRDEFEMLTSMPGTTEAAMFAVYHGPLLAGQIASLLSEEPNKQLGNYTSIRDKEEEAAAAQKRQRDEISRAERERLAVMKGLAVNKDPIPVVPVPPAVQAVIRDMAALTVADTHFIVATSSELASKFFVPLCDGKVLERIKEIKPHGHLRRRAPLIVSTVAPSQDGSTAPCVMYCVADGDQIVRIGTKGRILHSLEGAIALWLLVVELLHRNEMPCGRSLDNLRSILCPDYVYTEDDF